LLLSRGKKLRTENKINKSIMTGRIAGIMITLINLKMLTCRNLHIKVVYKTAVIEKQIN